MRIKSFFHTALQGQNSEQKLLYKHLNSISFYIKFPLGINYNLALLTTDTAVLWHNTYQSLNLILHVCPISASNCCCAEKPAACSVALVQVFHLYIT